MVSVNLQKVEGINQFKLHRLSATCSHIIVATSNLILKVDECNFCEIIAFGSSVT